MTMSLGPYAFFIVASYLAVALVVLILIGWIVVDYRRQTAGRRAFGARGVRRRSRRGAADLS